MIITRAPLRLPLGGGGTDLQSYYSLREGALISAGLDKYIYVNVNKRFESSFRVSYSRTEIAENVDDIQHPIVREALRFVGIRDFLEITTIADIPANTGLGSSSTFTVALLLALHTHNRSFVSRQELAEQAYHIEHDILGEPCGKQDQYAAAFGGIVSMDISRVGNVRVGPLTLSEQDLSDLETNLLLFYTGIRRSASDVLTDQDKGAREEASQVLQRLDSIKEIGAEIRAALQQGNIRRVGEMMDVHWKTKKQLSTKISNNDIDQWYDLAMRHGALGGKLMGAGGGGFLLFYCDENKRALREAMSKAGLREVRFHIDWDGAKVLVHV